MTTLAPAPPAPSPPRVRRARPSSVRHAGTLAWRGDHQDHPLHGSAPRRHAAAGDLPAAVRLRVRRRHLRQPGRLPAARAARRARADDRVRLGGHRRRARRGPLHRHLRPLPQPAHLAQRPARRRDTRRPRALPDVRPDHAGARAAARVPDHDLAAGRRGRVRSGDGVRLRHVLGVHGAGDGRRPAAVGAGPRRARDVAADVRQQRLRAHRHPAVVAARVRRDQPGDARGGRRARAAQRRAGGRAGDVRAGRRRPW